MEEASINPEFISSLEGIKTIERYEIMRKLGRGGAGVVFMGRDPYIKRLVAIKISQTPTDKSREKFLVEAQSAGQFNHPNIVGVYDVGVQSDFCYLTMEYIEGSTLEEFCREENLLPLQKVAEIILSVCSALNYSHKRGIIHRDIKPANIMLDKEGVTKIADFGVAQMTESTAVKGIVGTPSYMSPEQLKEEMAGVQSDVFALGCVLYELLAGEKAFPGDNSFSIIYKIINTEPESISGIRSDLPVIMEEITKKAIAKDPEERYQDCTDFAYDLRVALRGLTETTNDEKIKNVVDYVHHLKFFHTFSEDQVKEIVSLSHIIKVKKDKNIVGQGEIDDTFYIIMSGKAKVRKNNMDIAMIGTGDCLGEMALIGGQIRIADVIACTDCVLLKINAALLDNASDSVNHLFYKNFAITLVNRLSVTSNVED
ncbi:protein kinase [Thermodesulfobacteriota bacterium]